MNFYEKIEAQAVNIPSSFDMRVSQLTDLKKNSPGIVEFANAAFIFGYMQGVRAERAGKAVQV